MKTYKVPFRPFYSHTIIDWLKDCVFCIGATLMYKAHPDVFIG